MRRLPADVAPRSSGIPKPPLPWLGYLRYLLLIACALTVLTPAHASKAWDQAANIREAAKRLVEMHRAQGSRGVIKFLDACYKTHTLASDFSAPLEACMAQDYMHARVLAEIYARLPADAQARMQAPSAEVITQSLNARLAAVVSQYALSAARTDALWVSIESHGMPIFLASALPPPAGGPAAGSVVPRGEGK